MKRLLLIASAALAGCTIVKNGDLVATAVSPDGRNSIRLYANPSGVEVLRDGEVVVDRSRIGLKVNGGCLCRDRRPENISAKLLSGKVATPVYKKATVDLSASETFADYGDLGIRLIARNDGVAYRFETKMKGEITIDDERFELRVPDAKAECLVYRAGNIGNEESVAKLQKAGEVFTWVDEKDVGWIGNKFIYMPFAYTIGGTVVSVTDADVYDYPVLNFERPKDVAAPVFTAAFQKNPVSEINDDGIVRAPGVKRQRKWRIKEYADYLVKTEGTRVLPWRLFQLADSYAKLCESDAVYALSRPQTDYDFSWVKPGKVAWDWWNAFDNKGDPEGCTTATYRRFIDFAAKNGVEYVIFDEGWSEKLDIWKFHPNVDVPALIKYGEEKCVGIILWMAWAQVKGDEAHVAEEFAKLGAKGFKVDFMDRGDADAERFLWKFADECARRKLVVDWHGAHRPTGMHRAYPNVLNYEGIHGLEQMKWYRSKYSMMSNDVMSFFGRLSVGPMDYTPGAMDNYTIEGYPKPQPGDKAWRTVAFCNPGSVGTRAHQMALMALYEAPLQMLADAPTKYEKNMESFAFMAKTPVVWDDTKSLGGCPKSYAAVARKAKDGSWYVAAIGNDDEREITIDTAFLGSGEWRAEIFRDDAESSVKPMKYVHETKSIKAGEKLVVRLARGGGFIAHLK